MILAITIALLWTACAAAVIAPVVLWLRLGEILERVRHLEYALEQLGVEPTPDPDGGIPLTDYRVRTFPAPVKAAA
jgi:hypothetical protein